MAEGSPARPQFGSRFLDDPSRVYEHNAWDSVEWSDDLQQSAVQSVRENSAEQLAQDVAAQYEAEASIHWDSFYQQHQNRFFKDRHWLFTEFPELKGRSLPEDGAVGDEKFTIFEVGCGAGNTVFPILQTNVYPGLFVYCCDFAASAVQIVKSHPLCEPARCLPFQCDITSDDPLPFPPASIDLVILIFVLSAIQPSKMQGAVDRLAGCLKPGGSILFRDYGRYDMAQLRFKKGHCLSANFYVRGDGTRVYFFTEDEVSSLFSKAGLHQDQLYVDRRLQVNRGRQLKMYRVWIQAKYKKTDSTVQT